MTTPPPYKGRTLEARLAPKTRIDPLTGCHIWEGTCDPGGYPRLKVLGRPQRLHRFLWIARYGPIPPGMVLCHRCDERRCINPDHHFVGTHQDNMRDMHDKRRARAERGLAILKGECGLPADVRPEELTPMRLFLRGVEITGKVLVRPFVAGVAPPKRRRAARSSR